MANNKKTIKVPRPTGTAKVSGEVGTLPNAQYEYEQDSNQLPENVIITPMVYQHIRVIHFCNATSFGRNQPFVMSFQTSSTTRAELLPNGVKITQDNRKEYVFIPMSNIKCLEIEDVGEKL